MRRATALMTMFVAGLAISARAQVPLVADDTAQITLEVRFLSAPGSVFEDLRKQHTLRTPAAPSELVLADVTDEELAASGGVRLVSATSVVETRAPVFAEPIGDQAVRQLIAAVQADPRGTIMLAPKVTIFDQQTATVADITSRPFVVGLKDPAGPGPEVRAFKEGTEILVRCQVRPEDRVRVDFRARLSAINDVGLLETQAAAATVQVPQVEAEDIQLAVELPTNGTLAVHSVLSRSAIDGHAPSAHGQGAPLLGVPLLNKVPYVSKLFQNTPPPARQELVILLTPRIVTDTQVDEPARLP
jgi:type II secretory pathway component GspD/PulD (secretin)